MFLQVYLGFLPCLDPPSRDLSFLLGNVHVRTGLDNSSSHNNAFFSGRLTIGKRVLSRELGCAPTHQGQVELMAKEQVE